MQSERQTGIGVETVSETEFLNKAFANPHNIGLSERLSKLDLPQCHLVAGCLFQAVWNVQSGADPTNNITDYDVFYFDDSDLSWEAEDRVIQEIVATLSDLPIRVDVKNQARVHLWYEEKFGSPYPPLKSAQDGIDRYLVECTCMGIEISTGNLYAPYGLQDACNGILRINPKNPQPEMFLKKAESYRARWPMLTIVNPT